MRAWGTAPGKIILFGEHAVVYHQPAIAVPVMQIKAYALAQREYKKTGIVIYAQDLGRRYIIGAVPEDEPLAFTCRNVLRKLRFKRQPHVRVTLWSDIPIASGLGSGAATATAIAKALTRYLGKELSAAQLSALVYETEKIHHGTPSGIDNTVVAYQQPVWFQREQPIETFHIGAPLTLLIADTGISSPTRHTVGDVRKAWQKEPKRYERLFDAIGEITKQGRQALEEGNIEELGRLMNENHKVLIELGVSSEANDQLVAAAQAAGALGAKLSGGGRGGNNVILVPRHKASEISQALQEAGAVRVLQSSLKPSEEESKD